MEENDASQIHLSSNIHPALLATVTEALNSKQIFTVLQFVNADIEQIVKIGRISFREALDVRGHLLRRFSVQPQNAFDSYKMCLKNSSLISTGVDRIDSLLDGGLWTGNIYEISGMAASGKTQFCLSLVKHVANKLGQNVHYLDTKFNFHGKKMQLMLNDCSQEQQMEVLNRIFVQRIFTMDHLINCLKEIKTNLIKGHSTRLIIIDSLPALIFESSQYIERNHSLNLLANIMHFLSIQYHIAFLITNLITCWNDGNFQNLKTSKENVACGKYWSTIPNFRLKVKRINESNSYSLAFLNNTEISSNVQTNFRISSGGLI